MKKVIISLLILSILSGLISCKKSTYYTKDDFVIEFGSECGWCAGEEYITVTPTAINYKRTIPCGDDQGVETKNKSISTEKWDSIWSSFDYDLFKTLDYNECNLCADGCDEIIRITKFGDTHEIRYSPGKEIAGVDELKQHLAEILLAIKEQD